MKRGRGSEVSVQPEGVVCGARHHSHPLVLAHPLLKEVGLSLQRDVLHEVKRVLHQVDLHTERGSVLGRRGGGAKGGASAPALFRPASFSGTAPPEDHSPSGGWAAALGPHDWPRSVPLRVSSSQSLDGVVRPPPFTRWSRSPAQSPGGCWLPWRSPAPASGGRPQTGCIASSGHSSSRSV